MVRSMRPAGTLPASKAAHSAARNSASRPASSFTGRGNALAGVSLAAAVFTSASCVLACSAA